MDSADETVRVFFALWPSSQGRALLAGWQDKLKPLCRGRAMRPDSLHATLVFLGEVGKSRLEALQLAALEVEFDAFELSFDTARYWGHNHIVFAAPGNVPAQLLNLVGNLEQSLRRHTFHFESRPYKPHVTLLRNAQWSDAELPTLPVANWECSDFVLVQSINDGRAGHYEVLGRFAASALK
ncbi:MAG: RNA 2',3'-cyclic phosphodiesterase [Pseudomonadota bacterium]